MIGVFAVVVLGSAIERVWLTRSSWYYLDDWPLIVQSGSAGGFLEPYNGHLSPILLGVYHLQMELFGFGTYLPLRIVGTLSLLAVPVMMFLALRRYQGEVVAAVVALAFVWFRGMTLEPAALNLYLSMAFGIGFAWALSRPLNRGGDLLVAGLLVLSLCAAGSGVAVAAGGGVYLLATRAPLRRWLALVVPSVAWAAWWLRHVGHTTLAAGNTPLDGPGAIAGSLVGNVFGSFQALALGNRVLGAVLLAAFLARSAAVLWDHERDGANVLAWSAALLAWWIGLAVSRGSGASAGTEFRYAYLAAGFIALTLLPTSRDAVPRAADAPSAPRFDGADALRYPSAWSDQRATMPIAAEDCDDQLGRPAGVLLGRLDHSNQPASDSASDRSDPPDRPTVATLGRLGHSTRAQHVDSPERSTRRAATVGPVVVVLAVAGVLGVAVQGDLRTSSDRLTRAGCAARVMVALADQGPTVLPDDQPSPITMYLIRAGQVRSLTSRYGSPFPPGTRGAAVARRDCG